MSKYYKAEDIIRKRAEDLADTSYWEYGNPKNVDDWIEVAEMEFKDLPTIEVGGLIDRRCFAGKWKDHYYPHFEVAGIECSICGKDVPYWDNHYKEPRFCPNCGARMEIEE